MQVVGWSWILEAIGCRIPLFMPDQESGIRALI